MEAETLANNDTGHPAPPSGEAKPEGFPTSGELSAVESHLDDVEVVLKNLDVDKGLEAQCRDLDETGHLFERPALEAYWNARTAAADAQRG